MPFSFRESRLEDFFGLSLGTMLLNASGNSRRLIDFLIIAFIVFVFAKYIFKEGKVTKIDSPGKWGYTFVKETSKSNDESSYTTE